MWININLLLFKRYHTEVKYHNKVILSHNNETQSVTITLNSSGHTPPPPPPTRLQCHLNHHLCRKVMLSSILHYKIT